MIVELGHWALILGGLLALVQAVLPMLAAQSARLQPSTTTRWLALAPALATAQALVLALAFGALVQAFVRGDWSVAYVVEHANSGLPLAYRIAGAWGGHEGSLLLWAALLAGWGAALAHGAPGLPAATRARVLAVLGAVGAGFCAFIVFSSNPFTRELPPAPDGRDLNPLLQDPGMALHPPLLYLGYVGFSVAFAFAVAALLEGRADPRWARWARPWTLAAWSFLTAGILLGSFWAYYELGWGGWWFWDAVENAALMPWLLGTALIHSLAVAEKRGRFGHWTVLLALGAFSLSLLGTFLVRSGVLSSVHAFAADPQRGLVLLLLLALSVGASLLLYAARAHKLGRSEGGLGPREAALLANNLLLATAMGTVLLGTLYPLAVEALGGGRLSVGAPYFESVWPPLMLPLLALLGLGPFLQWRGAPPRARVRLLVLLAGGSVAVAIVGALVLHGSLLFGLGLAAGGWVLVATLAHAAPRLRSWRQLTGRDWGLLLAHAGVGVFVLGVTLVKGLEHSHDLRLAPGESATVAGHQLQFRSAERLRGPNYVAARATLAWSRDDKLLAVLTPEKRVYTARNMPMTEAAIDRGFTRDLYLSAGETGSDGRWVLRLQVKPFMAWVWGGVGLIVLGGVAAALSGNRARRTSPAEASRPADVLAEAA